MMCGLADALAEPLKALVGGLAACAWIFALRLFFGGIGWGD